MANFFDQFDSGASTGASSSNFFDQFDEGSQQPKPTQNVLTDTAQDVIQGALRIPGAITGLADIPAGLMGFNRPFDRATDYIGEKTGIQPGKLADSIQANNYSPERVAANQRLDQTWQDYQSDKIGLGEALADTVTNPRALLGNVVGSVPSMYAGGMLGNAARAAGLVSKAAVPFVGEGAVMAGQAMDNIDASVDPQKAAILSAATGLGGGLLARGGGKLSEKMGLVDPDVAIANGLSQTATKAPIGLGARTAGGFLAEGAMEELPQSLMEQGLQNYAEDKPLTEGMARAGVEGLLSGGLMGAGFNAFPQSTPKVVEKPISDGPLGNAAAAGGITQTEISDAGTTNQEALIPEQNLGGSSGAVLPASNGLGGPNDAMPEPEPLVDQTGAATTGNEAESALATQQAPSPVDFQPTHLSDDGTPVAYREDDQGPYFETADGQQWNYTDTATPIKQEVQNANSPTGSVAENNPPITGQDSGTGSDQRGFDTSLEPTDGRVDDRGISGADGQLRGAESPSDVESGGALNAESSSQNTDAFRGLSTRDGSAEQITPNLSPDGLPVTGESTGNTDSASVQNETSSPVNRQYLLDQGVTESDISRIDQALNNNPGLAQKPLGFIRSFLKDKYQGLDYSQVIQDVSTQQSPASSLDAITTQSQPDAGFVSSQPGSVSGQSAYTTQEKNATQEALNYEQRHAAIDQGLDSLEPEQVISLANDLGIKQRPNQDLVERLKQEHPDEIETALSKYTNVQQTAAPETQPVLPNTGADQTGNASTVGTGQGQSAVSGQEEVAPPSYQSAVDAQFKQKSYDAPTKALGGMTPREYGKQHVEAGHQFVEKDGKYYLKGDGAGMKQIPKATYLYGSALEKAARESGDYVAPETTQAAPQAIHIEGAGIERVTPSVVSNAMQKAAERKHTSKTQMREWLVGEIDKAISQADSYMERGLSEREIDGEGKLTGKRLPSNQADTELGHKVFDVPGDGAFKVLNARENLEAFKNKVLASSGFKETRDAKGTRQPSQAKADALRMAEKYIREGEHDFAGQILANAGIDAAAVDSVLSKFKPEAANAVRQAMIGEQVESPKAETTTPFFDKLDKSKGIVPATHKAIKDHPNAERIAMIHNRFNDVLNDHGFEPNHGINGNITNRIKITC